MKKNKILFISIFLGLIIITGLIAWLKSDKKVTSNTQQIRVGYDFQSIGNIPLIVGVEKGYFAKYGVNVILIPLKGKNEIGLAMAAKKIDIAIITPNNLLGLIDKGAPIKFFSPMGTGISSYMFVRPSSNIKTLKDLEGKNIGMSAASSKELIFRYALKKVNIDLTKINIVDVDKAYQPIALMQKKNIDAVITSGTAVDECLKIGATEFTSWRENYDLPWFSSMMLAADTGYITENSKAIQNFLLAMTDSHRFAKNNLSEAAIITSEKIKNDTAGAIDTLPGEIEDKVKSGAMVFKIWDNMDSIKKVAEVSYETGQTTRLLTLDDIYDLRFMEFLKKAQLDVYGTEN